MDLELKNFIKVWTQATIALCYCYLISSKIPKGLSRLVSLLPVISLFIFLPLNVSSFHLTLITAACLVWIANFRLLLFAFDQGPLSSPTKLHLFILTASLPIKIKSHPPPHSPPKPPQKLENPQKTKNNNTYHQLDNKSSNLESFLNRFSFVPKVLLVAVVLQVYQYKENLHDYVLSSLYCCHLYLELETSLVAYATLARYFGFEPEPCFNEPYLATSLQDFWGRRWNLVIIDVLRPVVYDPVKRICARIMGQRWAIFPSIIAVFTISGLIHELLAYYLTRVPSTWDIECFFVLQGVCLVVEILLKQVIGNRWQLHWSVSGPLTLTFVMVTAAWMFFPHLIRNHMLEKDSNELFILTDFIKHIMVQILGFIRVF